MIEVKHHPFLSSDTDSGSFEVALSVTLAALVPGLPVSHTAEGTAITSMSKIVCHFNNIPIHPIAPV